MITEDFLKTIQIAASENATYISMKYVEYILKKINTLPQDIMDILTEDFPVEIKNSLSFIPNVLNEIQYKMGLIGHPYDFDKIKDKFSNANLIGESSINDLHIHKINKEIENINDNSQLTNLNKTIALIELLSTQYYVIINDEQKNTITLFREQNNLLKTIKEFLYSEFGIVLSDAPNQNKDKIVVYLPKEFDLLTDYSHQFGKNYIEIDPYKIETLSLGGKRK